MSKIYSVAVMGLGVRGKTHLKGLLENADRFQVVALCDIDQAKMEAVAEQLHLQIPLFTDAETMLQSTRPDIFVFVTYPNIRLSMVQLAIKYNVKALSFEKPMAEDMKEAKEMTDLCTTHNIKAIVCHQQKYLSQMQNLKKKIEDGNLGKLKKVFAETQPWLAQLGTHYIDYIIWANGGAQAKWVVGHVHGPATLKDNHPSPDFLLGEIGFENGVRGYIECGYLSERHNPEMYADSDNRLTVWGTNGYAYAETDGFWGECDKSTGGELIEGKEPGWYNHQEKQIQTPYYREFADWLDDDAKIHSCNIQTAFHGYEILEAICISALDNVRVDLPLQNFDYEPVLKRMEKELPNCGTVLRSLYTGEEPREERD